MSYLFLFIPVWMFMALALRDQYHRGNTVSTVLLGLTSLLVTVRFYIVAYLFDGGQPHSWLSLAEVVASLYIMPCTYMFLCDQCGSFWNNREARMMLALPFLTLLKPLIPGLEEVELRDWVVIAQCLIIALCMTRLWYRIRNYELPFTRPLKLYYGWMGCLLFFTILSFAGGVNHTSSPVLHGVFFVLYALIIGVGYLIIPYSFQIPPVVPVTPATNSETEKESETEDRTETTEAEEGNDLPNQHLIDALHKLMEEELYFLEENVNIDDLAQRIGTNRTYVSRLMRQEYGLTFIEYVNVARIQHSQKLLYTSPDLTLEEVALKSGYQSSSNYFRAFKRYAGCTPKQWQQESRH